MEWLQELLFQQKLIETQTGVYDQATMDAVKLIQQNQLKYETAQITGLVDEATANYLMTVNVNP